MFGCLIRLVGADYSAHNMTMKANGWRIICICFPVLLLANESSAIDPDLARFATLKENQIRQNAKDLTNRVPRIVWSLFDAVRVDDWETATNLAHRINLASGLYTNSVQNKTLTPLLQTLIWPSVNEMIGTYEQFHNWDNKWLHRFGSGIIDSIPAGSIYFGGTDPGRYIISALTEPNENGNRFFVLTQNQLADSGYLEYLRKRYGGKLYIPTDKDLRHSFREYVADAVQRLKHGALKPGEDVRLVHGRLQVSGDFAVMAINGLLVRVIMDKNPGREIFIEESYALDWMYPYLSPHGLIFQLHHEPLPELTGSEIEKDQDYWKRLAGELIGDWLTNGTPLKSVCDFSDKVFLDKNLDGFTGDRGFAKNKEVQKCYSKLRSSLAGMYAWRAEHGRDAGEKNRLREAADLAFRQAYAICPYSPEVISRYAEFLLKYNRPDSAFLLVKTSLRLDPDNDQLRDLMKRVRAAQ